jgi:cold shock protein
MRRYRVRGAGGPHLRSGDNRGTPQEVLGGMAIGVVKWFSPKKGYGFLTMDDGQEVFVHYTAIDGNGFRSLEQGEQVRFDVAQGPKGLQAAKVMRDSAPAASSERAG